VKSALAAAEFDFRTAAPDVAANLTRHVADLLDRAHAARVARCDATADDVMALVAGAFAAIRMDRPLKLTVPPLPASHRTRGPGSWSPRCPGGAPEFSYLPASLLPGRSRQADPRTTDPARAARRSQVMPVSRAAAA